MDAPTPATPQPGPVLSRDVIRLPDAGHERGRSRVLEESNNRDLKKMTRSETEAR